MTTSHPSTIVRIMRTLSAKQPLLRMCTVRLLLLMLICSGAQATTYYMDPDGGGDGSTWDEACPSWQELVEMAWPLEDGDVVLCSNGVYDVGGIVANGATLTNRFCLDKAITVIAVNGPDVTFIKGESSGGGLGPRAIRCAYLTNGAQLIGFTLTNGYTQVLGAGLVNQCGGGAYLHGGGTVSSCIVVGCSADTGGGIAVWPGTGTVTSCSIYTNWAESIAGGVMVRVNAKATVEDCTIYDNWSDMGGGLGNDGDTLVQNCTIENNESTGVGSFGGGLLCSMGNMQVVNSTISGNRAVNIGGGLCDIANTFLLNTIIINNTAGSSGDDIHCAWSSGTYGYYSWYNGVDGSVSGQANAPNVTTAYTGGDLSALADNGGFTKTMELAATAPAAGTGAFAYTNTGVGIYFVDDVATSHTLTNWSVNPTVTAGEKITFDQRGETRATPVDMGAYEILSSATPDTIYVDASRPDDSGAATNWATAKKTIQAGVNAVSNTGTVWVTNGTYNAGGAVTPGYALTNRVCITNAITLRSLNGPDVTIIEGAPGSNGSNDVDSIRGVFMDGGCALNGFTVTNGYTMASGNVDYDRSGGGVWMTTNCTASNLIVRCNSARRGGGVCVEGAGAALNNSTVSDNLAMDAVSGGGVLLYSGASVNNCTLNGNSSGGDGGGALLFDGGTLNNCLVSENTANIEGASIGGGGVYIYLDGIVNNCTVSSNTANGDGDGVCMDSGEVNNSIIWEGNNAIYNDFGSPVRYTCASDGVTHGTDGCITNDPLFVDASDGDYRLLHLSPCFNAGDNTYAPTNVSPNDLAGDSRIMFDTVDMGAYEVQYMLSTNNGPYAGGNTITITNGNLGDGSDITNVTVGGVAAAITGQGANWVTITLPAASAAGTVDIVVQSTSEGDTTFSNAYTYNPQGTISGGAELTGAMCNYTFMGDLTDSLTNGLDMIPVDVDTQQYTADGWRWTTISNAGGGLQFDGPAGTPSLFTNYSIGIRFQYDQTGDGYRKILDYKNRTSDNGFYLYNQLLRFYPYNLDGTNVIGNNDIVDFILTYNGSSTTIDVYVVQGSNVVKEFSVADDQQAAVPYDASGRPRFMLFIDDFVVDEEYTPGGTVRRVKLWDRPLNPADIQKAMVSLTGVVPENGSWTGGYTVVISGTNLCNGTLGDVTNVTLAGSSATVTGVAGSTQIVVTAGSGTLGLGDVRVYSITYGETIRSNAFMYLAPDLQVKGIDQSILVNNEAVSITKGNDFGHTIVGSSTMHTFSLVNTGGHVLAISGILTNGPDAEMFAVEDMPATVLPASEATFTITFSPSAIGDFTAALQIANDSLTSPYIVNLAGAACVLSTNIGPYAGGNIITITNGSFGTITNVLVSGVTASIQDSGNNWVQIMLPATGYAGTKDIIIQTSDNGAITLQNAYTYRAQGVIGVDGSVEMWEEVSGFPDGYDYDYGFMAPLGTNLYALPGGDYPNMFRYDGSTWTEVDPLPKADYPGYLSGATYDGYIYSVGGYEYYDGDFTNVYRYDGSVWEEVEGLPGVGQYSMGVAELNGSLYAIGGGNDDTDSDWYTNVYRFDGSTWTEVAGLPIKSGYLAAGTLGGRIYAIGGTEGAASTNVYAFDGTNWTAAAGIPTNSFKAGATVLNDKLYVTGNDTTNLFVFDGTNWSEALGAPVNLRFDNATWNDKIYASGNGITNVFRYTPYKAGIPGVVPNTGSYTGGYTVVINGLNLCDGNLLDVTNVTLCGVPASVTTVNGSTQIIVTAGGSGSGLGDVVVDSIGYGQTTKSNAFTYTGPVMQVQGTNGAIMASDEAPSAAKGTAYAPLTIGAGVTNTFSITNSGNAVLIIDPTDLSDPTNFSVAGIPATVDVGGISNFTVAYAPTTIGNHTATLVFTNNGPSSPFILNLAGSCYAVSVDTGPSAGGNSLTITNGMIGNGSDITNVTVCGVAATITGQGTDWVTVTLGPSPNDTQPVTGDIFIQSTSEGDSTLSNAYTYNPQGEIYDNLAGGWQEVAGLPVGIAAMGVEALHGWLYSIGGTLDGPVGVTNTYRFNGTAWETINGIPQARVLSGVVVLQGKLYAIAGSPGMGVGTTNVFVFDGTNWTEAVGLPEQRCNMRAVTWNDRIYAMGGEHSGTYYTNVYVFDGTNWTETAGLPEAGSIGGVGVVNDRIYYAGSYDGSSGSTNNYEFDGTNWTQAAGVPFDNIGFGSSVLDDELFVFGGIDVTMTMQTNVYSFNGSTWNAGPSLPMPLYIPGGGTLDYMYSLGGINSGMAAVTNVFRFSAQSAGVTPASGSWTGGYSVVIAGTNLCNGTLGDVTTVSLAGVTVRSIDGVSGSTQIVVTADTALVAGTGDVQVVSTAFGTTIKTNAFEYTREQQAALVFTPTTPQTYLTTNALTTTGGSGTGVVSYAIVSGPGQIVDSTNLTVTSGTGTIEVSATKAQDDLYYEITVTASVVAAKASGNVYLESLAQTYDGSVRSVTATSDPSGLTVEFTYDGNAWAPTNAGSYAITGTINDVNYQGSATDTLVVDKAIGGVYLSDLAQTYDGTARSVTATSDPSGLTVEFTYEGNAWAPTNAGSYAITGTINDVNYQGSAIDTLVVDKAIGGVYLADLAQTYDGTARSVTATSDPSGLTVEFTYDGNAWAPTNAGSYAITGTINDVNYQGSATDTLVVDKANQAISDFIPTNGTIFLVTDTAGLSATASSGLAVTFATNAGPALITGATNLSFTGGGAVQVIASQAGDSNWNAASEVTNTYTVTAFYTLTINSEFGSSTPAPGVYTNELFDVLTNQVTSPDTRDTTQFVCTGWVMTGNSPLDGATTSLVMTITNDAALTWLWTTNYWLNTEADANGSVNVGDGWQAYGVITQITATANSYYHFTNWTGDASGAVNPLNLPMDAPKRVTANFAENLTTNTGTPEWWLAEYGLTNFEADAEGDEDGDRIPSWAEYIANTDPTNPASFLHIATQEMALANCVDMVFTNPLPPNEVYTQTVCDVVGQIIYWPCATDRLYDVEYEYDVPLADWIAMEGMTNIAPDMDLICITNMFDTSTQSFYRLRVRLP